VAFTDGQSVSNLTANNGEIVTLFAIWVPDGVQTYTVIYDANGGSGNMADSSFSVGVSQALSANTFTLTGYTFAGWATTAAGTKAYNDRQEVTNLAAAGETVTLFATWTLDQYTVTFNTNGGSSVAGKIVTRGDHVIPPANPTKTGYTFDNWYGNSGLTSVYNFSTPVTDNITLYAKWNPITYTVIYDKNAANATGNMADTVFTYGVSQALRTNTFSRTGYTFRGWATASDGGVKYNNNESVSNLTDQAGGNVTLFAIWGSAGVQAYTVTFVALGGIPAPTQQTVERGDKVRQPAAMINLTGATFLGWSTVPNSTDINFWDFENDTVNGNLTLYAVWSSGDHGPVDIEITVKHPGLPDDIELLNNETLIISRTGNGYPKTVTLTVNGAYDSVAWHIHSANVPGYGPSYTLNAGNSYYNNLGEHFLTIDMEIDGKMYSRTITFIVVP
jgi:uncharacterized repeat protein (TIGR02543 family)